MRTLLRWGALLALLFTSLMVPTVASAAATASTMFQVDAAHDGYVYGAGVVPPLTKAWYHDGGYQNGSVAIDAGHAFAFTHTAGSSPVTYVASLSLATGAVTWRTSINDAQPTDPNLVVAGGRVFTVTGGVWPAGSDDAATILSAFNESTGALLWSEPLRNPGTQQAEPSAPVAANGLIYLESALKGGTAYAINQATGAQVWTMNTLMSSQVTLIGSSLVVAGECGLSSGLNAGSGSIAWTDNPGCSAGGNLTSSSDGTSVWAGDPGDIPAGNGQGGGEIFNPTTGATRGVFPGYSPAFGYGEAVQVLPASGDSDLEVRAFNPTTLATKWTFTEPGNSGNPLGTEPLLADGYVFVTGSYGQTWALDPCTGAVDWTAATGKYAPAQGLDPLPGLAAGDGYLVVPSQLGLTAFKGSSTPSASAPSCTT